MEVRGAVSFTDARKAGVDLSVGLAMPSPPSWTVGQDSYVPDWSMKGGGLLRLVKDIRELRAPKGLIGFVCPTLSLRRKSTDWRDHG